MKKFELVNSSGIGGERVISGCHSFTGSNDLTLKVWDLQSGQIIAKFSVERIVNYCSYSYRFHSFIVGDRSGRINIIKIKGMD